MKKGALLTPDYNHIIISNIAILRKCYQKS